MQASSLLVALLCTTLLSQAHAQAPTLSAADRATAARGFEVLNAIHKANGSQESAARRCRSYMEEARSAEKLGARDMAMRNWDKAARGCKSDALVACRKHKGVAPADQCASFLH
jgi:hypothetical protein